MIYLDHAATTPLDPKVLEKMMPYFMENFGNPSSVHQAGRVAHRGIDLARETVSNILNADAKEIIFTSGGSESNNLAIKGVAMALRKKSRTGHIITTAIEHHSVLHTIESLAKIGFDITILPVDQNGFIRVDDLKAAIRTDTFLVSIGYANNEIGTIQSIPEIGQLCQELGIIFHTDAVQAAGLLPIDVDLLNVDLLTLTAHKFYGPRGAGILYVRKNTPILPLIDGGGQERELRAGTENTPAIIGLAKALELAEANRNEYFEHCTKLRDLLIDGILNNVPGSWINGSKVNRLPNNVNVSFDDTDSDSLLLLLDQNGICASNGSACSSGSIEPSHVLVALGLEAERVASAIRLTVGKTISENDIDFVVDIFPDIVRKLRFLAE